MTVSLSSSFIDLQMSLDSIRLNMETDWISGWISGSHCEHIEQIISINLELVQKEEIGVRSTKNEEIAYR